MARFTACYCLDTKSNTPRIIGHSPKAELQNGSNHRTVPPRNKPANNGVVANRTESDPLKGNASAQSTSAGSGCVAIFANQIEDMFPHNTIITL